MITDYENGTRGSVTFDRAEPKLEARMLGAESHIPHEQIDRTICQKELMRVVVDNLKRFVLMSEEVNILEFSCIPLSQMF